MSGEISWDVIPYVTLDRRRDWWRYRYDKFGWTTRSSQLYESRLLRIGSPMFTSASGGHRRTRHRAGDPGELDEASASATTPTTSKR